MLLFPISKLIGKFVVQFLYRQLPPRRAISISFLNSHVVMQIEISEECRTCACAHNAIVGENAQNLTTIFGYLYIGPAFFF